MIMNFTTITMDTVFRDVPCDVIRTFMFKYMDWNSRLNFNMVMPPEWRIPVRFKKNECIAHNMYVTVQTLMILSDNVSVGNLSAVAKAPHILKLLTYCNTQPVHELLLHEKILRAVMIVRCNHFTDLNSYNHSSISLETKNKIIAQADILYKTILDMPDTDQIVMKSITAALSV